MGGIVLTDGSGDGYGDGSGDGSGSGYGYGYGYGYGDGSGYGYGDGYGYGSGDGYGYGSGYGDGSGDGYGSGSGSGSGYGDGYGYGSGSGSGYGDGYGYGYGDGYGYGYGSGDQAANLRFTYGLLRDQAAWGRAHDLVKIGATICYWRSDLNGLPCNGGSGTPARIGKVEQLAGPLVPCTQNALHGSYDPASWRGDRLWIVALLPPFEEVDDSKLASLQREIIAEVPNWYRDR